MKQKTTIVSLSFTEIIYARVQRLGRIPAYNNILYALYLTWHTLTKLQW